MKWSRNVVRKQLLKLRDSVPRKSKRGLARKLGESDRLIRSWVNLRRDGKKPSLPGSEKLRQIGEHTNVSIDWLLGFDDVPMMRKDRAHVSQLARELVEYVARRCPSAAVLGGYIKNGSRTLRRPTPPVGSARIDLPIDGRARRVRNRRPRPAPDSPNELVIEPDAQQRFLDDVVRWALGRRRVADAAASLDAASAWPQDTASARAHALRAANVAVALNTADGAVVRLVDMETGAHVDWPGEQSHLRAPAEG